MSEAIIATDRHGKVTYINWKAEELIGWSQHESSRCDFTTLVTLARYDSRIDIPRIVEQAIETRQCVVQLEADWLIRRDGTRVYIAYSLATISNRVDEVMGVVVSLRRAEPPAIVDTPVVVNHEPVCVKHTLQKTILLVDDEPSVLDLCRAILEQMGHAVLSASSGETAIELSRNQGTIDLLLTDILMPGMTGPKLYDTLSRERPAMPVLFMSGYAGDDLTEVGYKVSEHTLMQKPFSILQFRQRVSAMFDPST